MKTLTPEMHDAKVKAAAQTLLHELENLSEESWKLLPTFPPEVRQWFMADLRDVAERGMEALRDQLKGAQN